MMYMACGGFARSSAGGSETFDPSARVKIATPTPTPEPAALHSAPSQPDTRDPRRDMSRADLTTRHRPSGHLASRVPRGLQGTPLPDREAALANMYVCIYLYFVLDMSLSIYIYICNNIHIIHREREREWQRCPFAWASPLDPSPTGADSATSPGALRSPGKRRKRLPGHPRQASPRPPALL